MGVVAIDVGHEDTMPTPGAKRSRAVLMFDSGMRVSVRSSIAPTLIAVEMHAGVPSPSFHPLFPAATIVAMPTARS